MKKICLFVILCSVFPGAVLADNASCPVPLTCYSSDNQTVCDNLSSDWVVNQQLPTTATSPQIYGIATARWSSVSDPWFSNAVCNYQSLQEGNNRVSITRKVNAPMVYPDMTDFWGWQWSNANRTAASCTNYGACLLTFNPPVLKASQ